MLAISLLATILAATLATAIAPRYGRWDGALISAAAFVLVAAIAGAALPAIDEVPDGFPAGVLWNFRLASIGASAIFWCALGLSFGAMADRWVKRRPG
jgi:predicted cobalt transporter CbtA